MYAAVTGDAPRASARQRYWPGNVSNWAMYHSPDASLTHAISSRPDTSKSLPSGLRTFWW